MKKSSCWSVIVLFMFFVSMAGCASQVSSEVKEPIVHASKNKKFGDMLTYTTTHMNNSQSGCSVVVTDVKFECSIIPEGLIQSTVENKPPFPATLKPGESITASVKIFTKENCSSGNFM